MFINYVVPWTIRRSRACTLHTANTIYKPCKSTRVSSRWGELQASQPWPPSTEWARTYPSGFHCGLVSVPQSVHWGPWPWKPGCDLCTLRRYLVGVTCESVVLGPEFMVCWVWCWYTSCGLWCINFINPNNSHSSCFGQEERQKPVSWLSPSASSFWWKGSFPAWDLRPAIQHRVHFQMQACWIDSWDLCETGHLY